MEKGKEMSKQVDVADWYWQLEAERNDTSWKTQPYRHQPPAIVQKVVNKVVRTVKLKQDDRDRLMFNAGRYAAGARDAIAKQADIDVQRFWE